MVAQIARAARLDGRDVGTRAVVHVVRVDGVQPAFALQLLDRRPSELHAPAIEVVERRVRPGRPDHHGHAIRYDTKPLFAGAQRALRGGAPGSLNQESEDDCALNRDDDQERADDVRHTSVSGAIDLDLVA
jgi:hypothetical protein